MKRLFSLMILVCLSFSLLLPSSAAPAQQDSVEITMTHIFSDEQDFRSELVLAAAEAFMAENPHVTVNIQAIGGGYGEVFDSAMLAASQGDAPNIVQVDESLTQVAIDSTVFVPISQVASDEQKVHFEDILPAVREFFNIEGELWGVPWNTSNPLLFYNKDIFREAGLDPENPPRTYAEVLTACEAILAAEIEGVRACANWPLVSWFVEQWVAMQGELLLNNENGRTARASEIILDTEAVRNVLEWWKTMADSGYYVYSGARQDYNGEGLIFLSKSTGIHINSTAGVSLMQSYSEVQGFELGIAPLILPNEEATNGVTVGGASLFVTGEAAGSTPEEISAAIDFVFFLTNTQNMAEWHKGTGYYPNTQSSIELLESENWFEENPAFRLAFDQALNTVPSPATAGMVVGPADEVRAMVEEMIQSIIDGGASIDDAIAAAKGRIDAELQDYNSLFE